MLESQASLLSGQLDHILEVAPAIEWVLHLEDNYGRPAAVALFTRRALEFPQARASIQRFSPTDVIRGGLAPAYADIGAIADKILL